MLFNENSPVRVLNLLAIPGILAAYCERGSVSSKMYRNTFLHTSFEAVFQRLFLFVFCCTWLIRSNLLFLQVLLIYMNIINFKIILYFMDIKLCKNMYFRTDAMKYQSRCGFSFPFTLLQLASATMSALSFRCQPVNAIWISLPSYG